MDKKEFEKEIFLNHSDFSPSLTPKQFSKYLKEMNWATLNQTNEIIKMIKKALTNARRKANTQIKDEQSMVHTHTAINQIDDELSLKLKQNKKRTKR